MSSYRFEVDSNLVMYTSSTHGMHDLFFRGNTTMTVCKPEQTLPWAVRKSLDWSQINYPYIATSCRCHPLLCRGVIDINFKLLSKDILTRGLYESYYDTVLRSGRRA